MIEALAQVISGATVPWPALMTNGVTAVTQNGRPVPNTRKRTAKMAMLQEPVECSG